MEEGKDDVFDKRMLVTYVAMAAFLAILALLSFLLVPQGNTVHDCGRLLLESSRYKCIDDLAVGSQNASMCGLINGSASDSCYLQIAQETNSSQVCGMMSNETQASSCITAIAQRAGNYSMCGDAIEPYASECEASVAVKDKDLTLCTGILNSTYSSECASIINGEIALARRSPGFCENVTNTTDKSTASYIISNISQSGGYAQLAGSSFMQSALVFLPNMTYNARDFCYTSVATLLGNETLCGKVSPGRAMSLCTAQAGAASQTNATANYTQMLGACADMGAYAQTCINQVALAQAIGTGNATLCGTLDSSLQTQCYSLLAGTYKNSTYCTYILDSLINQECISGSK